MERGIKALMDRVIADLGLRWSETQSFAKVMSIEIIFYHRTRNQKILA